MIGPFRRRRVLDGDRAAEAVAALASSIRSGTPPRLALETWDSAVPADLAAAVAPVCRRLALGADAAAALAAAPSLGPAAAGIGRCLRLYARVGGSFPALLDALALALRRSHETGRRSRAATSGARLSGRLVAGLPLACIPLLPGGRTLGNGVTGYVLLLGGAGLAAAGLWWIGRLVPAPVSGDPAAALADDLSVVLRAGAGLVPAFDALTDSPPAGLEEDAARIRRRVLLGRSWTAALRERGGALASLASVVERAASCGIPAADPLRAWAAGRRAEVRAEFERSVQRAPVLMVVPLTVCVLPSFGLLAFGPFLLGAFQGR
jgi:tight adherence protein B